MNSKYVKTGMLIFSLSVACTSANAIEGKQETLKVCAAKNEMPYSNLKNEGFENKIAAILAKEMDRQLEIVWTDKAAIFLVTELLLKNQCDVVMGVDKGDQRVATSNPYYKSGYVFIHQKSKGYQIENWSSPDLDKISKVAVTPGSPSEVMLRESGKYEDNFNYLKSLIGFKSIRNKYQRYEPSMMVSEVSQGKADLANLWAPEVARYVQESDGELVMTVGPETETLSNGEVVKQHFEQALAVRPGDEALLAEINTSLVNSKDKILAVLKSEGIPLL